VSQGDESGAGDVIEQGADPGGSRRPRFDASRWLGFLGPDAGGDGPRWRPSRGAAVVAAVALVAGLGAGYAAGKGTRGAALPPARLSPAVVVTTPSAPPNPPVDPGPPIEQFPESCSAQTGSELQVGVEVENDSATAVNLVGVKTTFPASNGVLQEVSWVWEPCGAISYGLYQSTVDLQPGASAWLSVTLKVNVPCPEAYPVQFNVTYIRAGTAGTTQLPGFPDLGSVPYKDCAAQGVTATGYSSASSSTAWSTTDDRAVTVDHW